MKVKELGVAGFQVKDLGGKRSGDNVECRCSCVVTAKSTNGILMQMFPKFISSDASVGRKESRAAFLLRRKIISCVFATWTHPSCKEPMKNLGSFFSFSFLETFFYILTCGAERKRKCPSHCLHFTFYKAVKLLILTIHL